MPISNALKTSSFATLILASLVAACGVGCESAKSYTFSLSVKNASPEPVTVWLTKRGGPEESEWLSPESLADSTAAKLDAINGIVIPAGKTGELGPISGKFSPGSLAVLRVYAGKLTMDQILATSEGKLRTDIPLREGANQLLVKPSLEVERK